MIFRKFKGILLSLGLVLSSICLASCSAFFGGDEGYLISDMTTKVDEEGNIIVTITFDDEEVKPLVFTIPKGISGETGVGIDHIEHSLDSESGIVTLTIYYTDESLEPTKIEVPVISGKDGVDGKGITNIVVGKDDIGNTTIQFIYSDETTSEVITVNKGIDGVGIKDITTEFDIENNRNKVVITYTNGESYEFYVSNGENGLGIDSITSIDNGTEYILTITYTDGSISRMPLTKPVATKWLSGNGVPSTNLGNDGDFYLNESGSGEVYKKENGTWRLLFSMTGTGTTVNYKVTFNVNGGEWRYVDQTDPSSNGVNKSYIIEEGNYINLDVNELEVIKSGYTFNGWWSDIEIKPNTGHFTNLTPVMDDLTLYANWIDNA